MKQFLVFILLFFSLLRTEAQNNEVFISCNYENLTFREFCDDVFRQTGIRIFYKDDKLRDLRVTLKSERISVSDAVRKALTGTGYESITWNDNIVIAANLKLIEKLPDYNQVLPSAPTGEKSGPALTESEERYITGRKPGTTQTITVGRRGALNGSGKAKVLGRVLDNETGEPMSFVTIYVTETKSGTLTDAKGFFTLMFSPGKYNLQVEFLGYEKEKLVLEVLSDGNLSVNMKSSAIQLKEVVVSTERQANIRAKEPGLDQLSVKSVKTLPMMMGERDIIKVSGTLPGIVSAGEGRQGLNVRGGGYDQNAFYLNKIQIYNTSHLFGFFPAFNSDIIKDFSIYKGHVPAQYGGRLASVFNITTLQGNKKKFAARGSVSPIAGSLSVEGPVKKDTSSFLLSARSSYSDWLLRRVNDTTISTSKANFNDLSGGLNWDVQKTQISLFGYHSYDHFSLSDLNSFEYSNNGGSLIIGHIFTNSLRGELSLVASQYQFSTIDKQQINSSYQHSYKLNQYEANLLFKHTLNEKNSLDYGGGIVVYNLNRGTVLPYGEESLRKEVNLGIEEGVESSLFISDSYDITPWMNLNIGFRYTLFTPVGPATVFKYSDGAPRDPRYIEDTLNFASGEPISWYHEPDIRAAVNIETDDNGSVKLAFNQMHQNIFMLSTTTSIAPNTQWKLADYHLVPPKSNQVSLGVFRTIPSQSLETSAEVFYKQSKNYPEFKDGADFLNNPNVETAVLQGDQKAYGLELYLKRSRRKLEGWISYTYSRSFIKVDGEHAWQRINNGEPYPSNFDIPHSFNLVLNYYLTRRVVFSSIFTYQSGKPITYPESVFYMNGSPYLDYSKRNAYQIPDYMRADFSLTVEGNLRKEKLIHSSLSFNVYNATGRMNPYSVYFKTVNGVIKSYQYSVIGVPIFTITWLGKFGNYESD
jgi:hypothetical protein